MPERRRTFALRGGLALRLARLVCALGVLCAASGCAARYPGPETGVPPAPCGAQRSTAGTGKEAQAPRTDARSGIWLFRHKVRLEIPARNVSLSFDGVMRLEADAPRARVAALAGLGLRLFDLEIEPGSFRVLYLHPSLKHLPGAAEHAAESIRRIWFDCLGQMPQTADAPRKGIAGGTWRMEAGSAGETPGTAQPDGDGTGREPPGPWPETIRFADDAAGYALTVRLAHSQRETTP